MFIIRFIGLCLAVVGIAGIINGWEESDGKFGLSVIFVLVGLALMFARIPRAPQ